MKILWLGNIILPLIADIENLPKVYVGGWMVGLSEHLGKLLDYELIYVFDSDKKLHGETEFYSYYGVENHERGSNPLSNDYIQKLLAILEKEKPDVIHIWGTENQHSLAMVQAAQACGMSDNLIISIQGLVSLCSKHYFAYLPEKIINGYTLKDMIQGNLRKRAKIFLEKGKLEIQAIKHAKHVIGRTDWDKAAVWTINSEATYHFNNETLRDEFYSGMWKYEDCEKYSIFCSQAYFPIKGLHLMLEALPTIKEYYPDVKLYIGGKNYYSLSPLKRNSYEKYILGIIKNKHLADNVVFTGFLSPKEMKMRYLKCNVFVSPSSIENSPNSVGEAMLLGVPVISSNVGGVHNMLEHGKEGYLYPADEPYMLAYYVNEVFEAKHDVEKISYAGRGHAQRTHDQKQNLEKLLEIYSEVASKLI
mgnify:CR=1 FL=1